ncbi:hypothetical protein G9A89_021643 [Geosiphon pyriformis]|nr:hypothetical protein G9A89_021643 [Geosiphon pyriformis]
MGTCCGDNEEYLMTTKFYCCPCIIECFGRPKQVGKCDNEPCLACGETLFDEKMWNNIPGRGKACDESYQYMILISDWIRKRMPIDVNECDLIYNLPICIIYTIPEEKKPISSCTSESESTFNPDLNSDNNDNKNNGSSSAQYGNRKYSNLNSDSNPKTYITFLDLTKEQKLKWFSDNNEGIMSEHMYNTNTEFDLRYQEKNLIKLEPHLHICIDLKIALEIPATTMIQLASRNSLAKKEINIRGGIIDAEYVRNIIAMLQNDSKKAYIIDPNEKIIQIIFLLLVKIAQLVSVGNRKKLGITAKGIQRFGSTDKIDVLVNMTEKKIIDKEEIISTHQPISIPP